ncbi:hypothetical protein DFA_08220 [Cavenderia fasciculata]|uniref:AB hydrolase-1 domain-containing protein n=1 Tax=Cavenderia fasciculata TaxID=261658 RepID=F4Q5H1_CACFS|nr:uncharacterized protein DFA_08220 [Cavenderia fasciculata]EGG17230.1 hypothetical protein DFA_08220 [Cavenderia fasciculata]|eukprot:XP_004355714.1 hypothetical protein DFA_08220 [Cavenderia fasciculata]
MPAWNFSKACFMDRFGYGWSDKNVLPVTTQEYVFRLHGSLGVAGLTGTKYVLVGWSWGSIFVQTYALSYPTEVVGIVTIDGTDSKWGFISDNQQAVISLTNTFTTYMTKLGLGSLQSDAAAGLIPLGHGYFPNSSLALGFTQASIDASQELWLTNKNLLTSVQELNIMVLSSAILNFTYTLKGANPLKDLPYVNIYNTVTNQDWTDRQLFMASLSTNSQAAGYNTDHYFPFTDSSDVITALSAIANRIATSPAIDDNGDIICLLMTCRKLYNSSALRRLMINSTNERYDITTVCNLSDLELDKYRSRTESDQYIPILTKSLTSLTVILGEVPLQRDTLLSLTSLVHLDIYVRSRDKETTKEEQTWAILTTTRVGRTNTSPMHD